jgi:hypothetical protein
MLKMVEAITEEAVAQETEATAGLETVALEELTLVSAASLI